MQARQKSLKNATMADNAKRPSRENIIFEAEPWPQSDRPFCLKSN